MRFFKSYIFNWKPILKKDYILLFYRIAVSAAMIKVHGIKKIMDWQGTIEHIPDPLGMGGTFSAVIVFLANIIGPILVVLGLCTRLAILPILSVTLMGFFVVHGSDPWSVRDVPLMYSLAYSLIFFLGPGRFALDFRISKKIGA